MQFCGGCAAPLAPLGLEQTDARGRSPVVTPGVVSGFAASDSNLSDGERKLVTILFADVAGFTALAETLDPEEVRDLLNSLFDRLVPCVERYEGTVDKFIGDEVMALFGAPLVHEDDPERAVSCALDMRAAVHAFNREWSAGLAIHVGINTGKVLAGSVGAGSGRAYSVMGDAVNVAARLTEVAGSGEILVGPDTQRLAGQHFEVVEVGPVKVKGRRHPVVAHRVKSKRDGAAPQRAELRHLDSPLVGRDAERAVFVAALDRLRAGRGGFVAILGEAGLGKSRLVAEVRREASARDLTWLEGRSAAFGGSVSYGPFLEIIRADSDIFLDDDRTVAVTKLDSRVARLLPDERERIMPLLTMLLGLRAHEDLPRELRGLDGEATGRRIQHMLRRYFEGLAAERPVIMVFEDVHWLDGTSGAMLERFVLLAKEHPILFCIVGRLQPGSTTERLREVGRGSLGDRYTQIDLSPLPAGAVFELVRNLVGVSDPASGLGHIIQSRAEGNPFFVEEVIRALVELGGLEPDEDGGWRITARAAGIRLPDTIENVILARVDRLDDSPKHVIKVASVIGRIFAYQVLAGVTHDLDRLEEHLEELCSVELIREKRRVPEAEYVFQHALVHEAAYGSLLKRQRRHLHLAVAEAIESLFADNLVTFYSRLADHYAKAEVWDRAREYLLKAGERTLSIAADAEAIAYFESALEAQVALARSRPDLADEISAVERARLWRKVATVRLKQRLVPECLTAVGEAETELDRSRQDGDEWWEEWIEVELQKALALYFLASEGPLSELLDAIEPTVRQRGTPLQQSQFLHAVVRSRNRRERFRPTAKTLSYSRAAAASDSGIVHEPASGRFGLGFCLLLSDHLDEAEEVFPEALALAQEVGDTMQQAMILAYMSFLHRRRRDTDRVVELSDRCISAAREGAVTLYQGVAKANLSWVRWCAGDLSATEQLARDGLFDVTSSAVAYPFTWLARWPLIGVLLSRGEVADAAAHAAAILDPTQQELPPVLAEALVDSVTAWGEGRAGEAGDLLGAAHELADSLGYG
ncbi:MAG: ATP-binding protein [Thermoleophilia bacterium]